MAVVVVCGILTALGVVAAVWWGGRRFPAPPEGPPISVYLWHLVVAVASGLAAGITVAGAGGRLVMRLLAATSPERVQGTLTEAEQTVGRITVDGTIGFVFFTGVFFGLATGVLYALIRRWLPTGRVGGVVYGLLLLVVFASRLDPLRADNEDFDIVGPSAVSLLAFGVLVVIHGMAVAAIAARYASNLPLIGRDARDVVRYLPLVPLLTLIPFALAAVFAGLVFVGIRSTPAVREAMSSRAAALSGRIVIALVALVCLPGFIRAVTDIAGRGP